MLCGEFVVFDFLMYSSDILTRFSKITPENIIELPVIFSKFMDKNGVVSFRFQCGASILLDFDCAMLRLLNGTYHTYIIINIEIALIFLILI